MSQMIEYKGVAIEVWEQSVQVFSPGHSCPMWFKRPVTDADIEGLKRAIDAGRASMAREINESREQIERLLGER
jgi:hypothetical protein